MIDLDKLSALEKAAKPAPWYAWLDPNNNNIEDKCITTIPEEQYIREYNALCGKRWLESNEEVIGCSEWMRADDADFLLIVEMRNQLPYLLARIAELDAAVSGPLENITKMLETVNADTIFAGVIQTWKNENQTLKSQIADLEKRNADLGAQVAALKEIAVEGWAVAEFGGEQEGQDYHLYFREWNIDRESYRKEARELLQAEHPEVFR
ncbi:TPA_asm: hypothetical protein vir525_00020 [Caudoviricetes sp. vir525]|nr:TPA_asm: hypothetical protein vir525_00020 [Caudoviricetes sp. vir525]